MSSLRWIGMEQSGEAARAERAWSCGPLSGAHKRYAMKSAVCKIWPASKAAAELVQVAAITILNSKWMSQRWPAFEKRAIRSCAGPQQPKEAGGIALNGECSDNFEFSAI
jgi:hypothetical protein